MVEMFEVMAEIEGFCGRLAARRMTPTERKDLIVRHKNCQPYVKAGDRESYHALNRPFHEAIYAGTHNRYLMDQAKYLYNRLAPYRAYHLHRPGRDCNALTRSISRSSMRSSPATATPRTSCCSSTSMLDSDLFADLMANLNGSPRALRRLKRGRRAAAIAAHSRSRVKGG